MGGVVVAAGGVEHGLAGRLWVVRNELAARNAIGDDLGDLTGQARSHAP